MCINEYNWESLFEELNGMSGRRRRQERGRVEKKKKGENHFMSLRMCLITAAVPCIFFFTCCFISSLSTCLYFFLFSFYISFLCLLCFFFLFRLVTTSIPQLFPSLKVRYTTNKVVGWYTTIVWSRYDVTYPVIYRPLKEKKGQSPLHSRKNNKINLYLILIISGSYKIDNRKKKVYE